MQLADLAPNGGSLKKHNSLYCFASKPFLYLTIIGDGEKKVKAWTG